MSELEIEEKLNYIIELLEESRNEQALGGYIDEKQVKNILKIKSTTLWKMRKMGLLSYSKIGNKVYYLKSDINELLESNKKIAYRK